MTKSFLLFLLIAILFTFSLHATSTKRICGEDGMNYNSYEEAANQNIQILHMGYCGEGTQRIGSSCIVSENNDCRDGLICNPNPNSIIGKCTRIENCSDNGVVCAYNGQTYNSECDANNENTAVAHQGACGERNEYQSCLVGINDCGDDGRYFCAIRPNQEPRACDPIMNEFDELTGCNIGICWENLRYECANSSECTDGLVCDKNHECTYECEFVDHEVTYCEDGKVCNYQNKCVTAQCTETAQCDMNAGEICEDRQFKCQISSCTEDKNCISGGSDYICNTNTNRCELKDNNDIENNGENGSGNEPGGCTMSTTKSSNGYIFFLMMITVFVVIRKKQTLK